MDSLPSYRFPYIVERIFTAVYKVHRIEIAAGSVDCKGVLAEKARQNLIRITLEQSKMHNKRLCIVFGINDCIFIEPSGSINVSTQPPRSGFDLYGTYDKPLSRPNGLDI